MSECQGEKELGRKPYSAPKLRINPQIDEETKKDFQRQVEEFQRSEDLNVRRKKQAGAG
jgi:hypothetical protein